VQVGPDLQEFYLYKELACYYSGYFAKLFDREPGAGSFAETESRKTKLDDVAVPSFEFFFQWLEIQRFSRTRQAKWEDLADLYILADRLDAPRLRNAIIDEIHSLRCVKFERAMARKIDKLASRSYNEKLAEWTGEGFESLSPTPMEIHGYVSSQLPVQSKLVQYLIDGFTYSTMLLTKFGKEAEALQAIPEDMLFAILLRTADMLRQGFCANILGSSISDGLTADHKPDIPKNTLIDLILIQVSIIKARDGLNCLRPRIIEKHNLCSYHDHKNDKEQEACAEEFRKVRTGMVWSDIRRVRDGNSGGKKRKLDIE
jgi:hypothetical protein